MDRIQNYPMLSLSPEWPTSGPQETFPPPWPEQVLKCREIAWQQHSPGPPPKQLQEANFQAL